MSAIWVVLAAAVYLYVMFSLAFSVDRGGRRGVLGMVPDACIYALSLAVYCTSWTFFGSVGRSASSGLGFLPIYIGPILVFTLAQPFLRKLLTVSKTQHITSIADFVAARYGKRQSLAALVTVIAVVGIVPYISLQLKAVASTFDILSGGLGPAPVYADSAFYLALLMAAFVIVFGTRKIDSTEQHRGMVATIAFESIVKLAAFLAVGIFVTYSLYDGFADIFGRIGAAPGLAPPIDFGATLGAPEFWSLTFLSALVIFCLPRQFQVTVVENTDPGHLRKAAWMFPLYLVAINVFVLPIAMAGLLHIREFGGDPDTLVLTLPLAAGHSWLALFAFIGGFSAATGMIIVETIALSTMVSNSLLLPALIRGKRLDPGCEDSVVDLIKRVRRTSILGILLLAYAYVHLVGSSYALVTIGLVSFVAVAQFAPSIVAGLYWRRADWRGAFLGLLAGFAVWLHTLLVPSLAESGWIGRDFLAYGPFGIESLRPYALFGSDGLGLDRISHSLLWSLLANLSVFIACSFGFKQDAEASALAASFVDACSPPPGRTLAEHTRWADIARLLERFLGAEPARLALAGYAAERGFGFETTRQADSDLLAYGEKLIAGVVGSSLARVVVAALATERPQSIEGAMSLLSDASEQIEVQWERLHAAVENINQGIAMFDRDLRLVVWNQRFFDIFGFPQGLAAVGTNFGEFVRHASQQDGVDVEMAVQRNVMRTNSGIGQLFEQTLEDGRVIEVQVSPLPNGGFVSTYTDISGRKRGEQALREAKQDLERRVEERTAELKESERRFRDFAESSSDWLWETDAADCMRYISRSAAEALSPQSPLLGRQLLSLANRQFVDPAAWTRHCEDVAARRPFLGVEYPVGESADHLTYIHVSGKPVFGKTGDFLGYRGTATDATVLVTAQSELLRHEKLSALGGLVAGVAHEINTPVGIGITAASHLAERTREFNAKFAAGQMKRSDLEAYLALVEESTDSLSTNLTRAAGLVRSFKQVAVDQSSDQARRFNVCGYIGEILDSLRPKLKRTPHTVAVDCPGELIVQSHPGALSQIIANLVINSLQHGFADEIPGRMEISIRRADRSLTIVYRDDGKGMPNELAKRIFDPFFTTRRNEGGSGLGMHIVYNLVTQKLGGRISCITAPGKGIIFTMVIPMDYGSDDD